MAYKGIDDIINDIGDTVEIIKTIKPIYNFKAGGD
jgi:tRNA-splicing ligase RtcB